MSRLQIRSRIEVCVLPRTGCLLLTGRVSSFKIPDSTQAQSRLPLNSYARPEC